MNPQPTGYPQYPPPPAQYPYANTPYPTAQPAARYTFPTTHSQQHQSSPRPVTGQQYQVSHPTPPTQQYQPPDQAQGQQPTPYFRPYAGPGPVPSQQQQQFSSASASQSSGSRKQQKQPARQNGQPESAPVGPGAPASGPDGDSPNLEEQLRDALQRENNSQGENESNRNDHDDDDDDDEEGEANANANPGDTNEPIFNIPPPPEGNYAGEQELEKSLHAWSLEHGYEMVRRASKKNANGVIYKRYYHCSKHGKLANTGKLTDETRQRSRRKSNRIGCPMSLAAVSVDPSNPAGEWQIRHRKIHHNHGPMEAVTLTGHRRRARMGGVEKAVDGLFAIGTPTAQILTFLQRTNPDGLFTRTDVANMKLKWKKYGTCQHLPNQYSKDPNKTMGMPSACLACRAKKTRCDSQRPTCANCVQKGIQCEYNHEPVQASANPQSPSASSPAQSNNLSAESSTAPRTTARAGRGPTTLAQNREEASQILADLQQYQMEHIKPKRLELGSSSVEILAQSSCGNGDSYRRVPTLYLTGDWQSYADEFLDASLKENTYDVLLGIKTEPIRPDGRTPGDGSLNTGHRGPAGGTEDEIDVEVWNEYVKQVAIFNRRNQALLGAMRGSLSPSFRTRINGFMKASEAWAALEEMCCPRGSEHAWKLYNELYSITLATTPTKNVSDYASRLETKYAEFCRLKMSVQHPHDRLGRYHPNMASRSGAVTGPATAADIVPEEALCMLFLRGLGEEWRKWVETLCKTSNVGGFGTGFKLGLRDLVKKAVEVEGARKGAEASNMT